MKKTIQARAFRPWPENEERLEFAAKLGLNVSDLINTVLRAHMREYLQKARAERVKAFRELESAPIP